MGGKKRNISILKSIDQQITTSNSSKLIESSREIHRHGSPTLLRQLSKVQGDAPNAATPIATAGFIQRSIKQLHKHQD